MNTCRISSNISLSIRTMGGQRNHTLIQEMPFKDENKPRQRTYRRKKRENVIRGQITLYCWCWRKKLVSLKSCNELWVPKIYLSPGDVCANRLPTKTQIYKLVNQWEKLGVSHPNWLKSISDDRNDLGEWGLYIFYGNVLLR